MSQTSQQALELLLDQTMQQTGIPSIAAAFVHNYGTVKSYAARGVRRNDKSRSLAANQIQPSDMFCLGSVAKPITGFLLGLKVKEGVISWDLTLGDAFPELKSKGCQAKYAVEPIFLDVSISQLMAWTSGMFDEYNQNGHGSRGDPSNAPEPWFQGNPSPLLTEWTNPPALRYRRFLYAILAMQSDPLFAAGTGTGYGGAAIVCAAILERKANDLFENMAAADLFLASGMMHSKYGRTATSPPQADPDGVFGHDANGVPVETGAQNDFNSHAPDGTASLSAKDMALFVEQNLPAHRGTSPRRFTSAELSNMQALFNPKPTAANPNPTAGQSRSGWVVYNNTADGKKVEHNGDNGWQYAFMRVYPDAGYGFCVSAMQNISKSAGPVMAIINEMESWEHDWAQRFPGGQ